MIIRIEQRPEQKDTEILITYPVMTNTVERLISLVNSADMQIECYTATSVKLVNVSDIFYIESNKKKTVVYCENEKFANKSRLYQIYEKLSGNGFVQISKYCIMNINKLQEFRPLANYHLEAVLSNGKFLNITRKYVADLKQKLQEDE